MSADINLLPQKKGNVFRSEQTLARVKVIAIICVLTTISMGIGIFLINQTNSPASLKTQEDALSSNLSLSNKKATAYLQVIDRLNHIQTIISSRSTLEKNMELVQKQIPDSVTIQSLSLNNKVLNFTIISRNLDDINQVILNMTTLLQTKKLMKKMTVDNVVADQKTGRFLLSIDATL